MNPFTCYQWKAICVGCDPGLSKIHTMYMYVCNTVPVSKLMANLKYPSCSAGRRISFCFKCPSIPFHTTPNSKMSGDFYRHTGNQQ